MSQIDQNRDDSIPRKKKRLNSNSENNYVEVDMWEQVELDYEGNVENSLNIDKQMENKEEEKIVEQQKDVKSLRSPLAPVSINQVSKSDSSNSVISGSSSSNNNNNSDIDSTLLATSEDFFRYCRDRPVFRPSIDYFSQLSDEMILHIFKWLPKKTLTRCCYVSMRFNTIVHTDILWTRLDLGGKNLKQGALGNVISRGVVILRLAQAEIHDPIFDDEISHVDWDKYESKLQYLDLSMCTISVASLQLLLSKCRKLKKLSLEHVTLNDDVCKEIAANTDMDSLNLTMCEGMTSVGVHVLTTKLKNLRCLNISWTSLTSAGLEAFVNNVTPGILRLNIAGCRNTMTDKILSDLIQRCPGLVELDISDCPKLTNSGLEILSTLKSLEYLSISRCYSIDVPTFLTNHLKHSPSLFYLDVFGLLRDESLELLASTFKNIGFNKFVHSSVARPTVGTRRTSIWGLRTRD